MENEITRKIFYNGVLNCPFCGSNHISMSIRDNDNDNLYNLFHPEYYGIAECENCGCTLETEYFDTEEKAKEVILEMWNRREN